ncbi:spermatogenesis-associated protein 7 homolog isoform X2 [Micropterus dolomieu]|uniref:spermatogenesis-associated protein 7 homolog isoform X2 n=1 Tax=Micropterus dolomieu TaxID=147949 RepID=UPI001E8D4040|nr:spermatogenesis-associated protein 7 homolog isoform X2 [Micropterus dolomieu]
MRKMGYSDCNIVMDSRIGSVSSGLGCSPGTRGQTLKSSPFCPPSSSKLTQSIIKDHMVSHYKKVYSAKAAIDASVPKSLIHSVKYHDQLRQERLRKGGRPQSAHSLSQRNCRASCSPAQSRLSVQYDDSPYLCSRSSSVSSPRFSTSFHAKEIVYPLCKVRSQNQSHHTRPASEIKYQSPEAASHRMQSACSLAASGDQSCYKTFQDPVQKTYSGDLLQKHSQHFTQDKPFTPKTLKSDKSSYLSKYRYYRAPRREPTEDCTNSQSVRQEIYHGSTENKEYTQEFYEPSQGFNTDHEWSEDVFNGTYLSTSRQHSRANKSRDHDFFDSSSRVSPEGWKSPNMKSVSTEEEELMYLEFISAVTEDILSRGHISDRVLDRVIKRHIDMNRQHLDEGKMRHLLEVLRKDFEEPANISTSSTKLEKNENGLLDTFLPHLESGGKQVQTKENNDLFPYASLIKYCDLPDFADPLLVSTPFCSPERTDSPIKTNKKDGDDDSLEKGISPPLLSQQVSDNTGISDENFQNQIGITAPNEEISNDTHEYTTIVTDEGFHQDHAEVSLDGQSEELENLGRSLSELLHVSSNTHYNNVETTEQHTNAAASGSDDEF